MRAWLSALVVLLGLSGVAHAEERITDFFSDVTVQADGDMIVTESISVIAEGDQIKRGLLRDFPTRYLRPDGTAVQVGFDVLDVRRDDHPEPYALEHLKNGVRIRMGSADVLLNQGPHQYVIRYRTTRQVGFFKDFDELYWNATGTGWTFPIDRARARITLPEPVRILQTSVYTGPQGATDRNAEVVQSGPGSVMFVTTAPLGTNEGLTVAAAWPKGVVAPPSQAQVWLWWVRDNAGTVVSIVGFLLLAGYYLTAVLKTRRRSRPMIVPLYEPPPGMSAPEVRYVVRQSSDQQTFVTAMLELISLRFMRIGKKGEDTQFERLPGRTGRSADLDPTLAAILEKLFRKTKTFVRDGLEGTRFEDAALHLEKSLANQYDVMLFSPNRGVAARGRKFWFVYLLASLGAAYWQNPSTGFVMLASAPFWLISVTGLTMAYGAWRRGTFNWGLFLFSLIFLGPMLVGGIAVLLTVAQPPVLGGLPGLLPLVLLPVVIRAFSFVKGYTEAGYLVMDQIAGFKRYLTLAEGPRLQALVTPEEKLEVYERMLPYAVALDVGKEWAAGFATLFTGVAAMAAVDAMQQYYGGHDLLRDDPSRSLRSISHEFTPARDSAAASSSSPGTSSSYSGSSSSSSSSGSSGGGSSGGGGGGGGGSGW